MSRITWQPVPPSTPVSDGRGAVDVGEGDGVVEEGPGHVGGVGVAAAEGLEGGGDDGGEGEESS